MGVHVVNRAPSFSKNLADALSGGLHALTQNKLREIEHGHRQRGLQALNLPPEAAHLSDQLLGVELANRGKQQMFSQKQAQENAANDALADEYGIPRENQSNPSQNDMVSDQPGLPIGPGPRPQGSPLPPGMDRRQAAQSLKNREVRDRAQRTLDLKEREVASRESKEARLFSDPYINKKESAQANIKDLSQLKELTDDPNLVAGSRAWLARYFGIDELARNLPTELAQKLVSRLKTNVASAYPKGTRITNFLDQTFQKTLPDLLNSPQGMRLIADLLIDSEQPHLLREQALGDLLQEWGGRVPPNATQQINKMIEPQIKELEQHSMDLIVSTALPQDEEPGTEGIYKGKKYVFGEDRTWHSIRE